MNEKGRNKKAFLNPKSIEWIGIKNLDRFGKTFFYNGSYYKAIYEKEHHEVLDLISSDFYKSLCDKNLIVKMQKSDKYIPGFSVVLASETPHYSVHHTKYTVSTLKQMALQWIAMMEICIDHGYVILDTHLDNFASFDDHIKWVDIGSLQKSSVMPQHISQFLRSLFLPILIMSSNPKLVRIGRMLLNSNLNGVEYNAITGKTLDIGTNDPKEILEYLKNEIRNINIKLDKTMWSDYTDMSIIDNICEGHGLNDERWKLFVNFIDRMQPCRAIDFGSSSGIFSTTMASRGIPCLSVDIDGIALDNLSNYSRQRNLPITTHWSDVLQCEHHPQVDFVSAMALTHHLYFTEKISLDLAADFLASRTSHALITEFMPNGLGGLSPQPKKLPEDYNLEHFLTCLRRYFRNVEYQVYKNTATVRVLIFCHTKISHKYS